MSFADDKDDAAHSAHQDPPSTTNGVHHPEEKKVPETKVVPGTTLKCLEDPSFEFEPKQAPPKKPSYRVLEDPTMDDMANPPAAKKPTYKVLEDPMLTSVYEPSTSHQASKNVLDSGATNNQDP